MSGVVANASENTSVSRTSVSYCGRVKRLGLRVGRSLTFDREQLVRVAHLVHAKEKALRIVKTTATSPRPSPTVVDNGQGRQRRPAERAEGVADVSRHAVEQRVPHRVWHREEDESDGAEVRSESTIGEC